MEYYSAIKKNKIMPFAAIWRDRICTDSFPCPQSPAIQWGAWSFPGTGEQHPPYLSPHMVSPLSSNSHLVLQGSPTLSLLTPSPISWGPTVCAYSSV